MPNQKNKIFGLCCLNGKIKIPKLQDLPNDLKKLFELNDDESKYFIENIRAFNSSFAMTSLGIDKEVLFNNNNNNRHYVFKI